MTSKNEMVLRETGVDFDVTETIRELESEMLTAANKLVFEKAALLRDQVNELKRRFDGKIESTSTTKYPKAAKKKRNRRTR